MTAAFNPGVVPGAYAGDVWIPARTIGERRYLTDRQKQAILDWLPGHTWTEAERVFGVTSSHITMWRRQTRAPANKRRPTPEPDQPVGTAADPWSCACGNRYPPQRLLAAHVTTAPKGTRVKHRLEDRPAEPARLLGTVRAGVTDLNRPEAVHVVLPHYRKDSLL